ncbi:MULTISPECIES: DUF2691 family protein [Clostridium]|uniref:DUF2691 family protein n=1 Tax=Clostridium TaxID=1485 RepID=UPI00082610E7|nr:MULTISPECIES: DUF2691 family protein [Clostridium]PJI07258.1 DUF2691 domain-containing protein [Clostridium sp. CT7]
MIGLDIKVKNEYNNYIHKIFDGIDLSNYMCQINFDDSLYLQNGKIGQDIFKTNILNGDVFLKCIPKDEYYIIFSDIKIYPIDSKFDEIKTFEDFMKSNCQMVFLCTDSTFIQFYSKDEVALDKVYSNCINNNFEDIKYIDAEDALKRNLIAW